MKGKSKRFAQVSGQCVACGVCESICPLEAVSVYHGMYAKVEEERCVGCGKCAAACPAGVISLIDRKGDLL